MYPLPLPHFNSKLLCCVFFVCYYCRQKNPLSCSFTATIRHHSFHASKFALVCLCGYVVWCGYSVQKRRVSNCPLIDPLPPHICVLRVLFRSVLYSTHPTGMMGSSIHIHTHTHTRWHVRHIRLQCCPPRQGCIYSSSVCCWMCSLHNNTRKIVFH